jgi:hypothetical protein
VIPKIERKNTKALSRIPIAFIENGIIMTKINTLSDGEDLRKLKGISFRTNDNGGIFNCLDANTITNLNEIPFPDRLSLMENY